MYAGQHDGHLPRYLKKNPDTDLADPITNTLESLEGKVAVQVASQLAVAVTFHGDERTPATAGQKCSGPGTTELGSTSDWMQESMNLDRAPESCGAGTRRRGTGAWRSDSNWRDRASVVGNLRRKVGGIREDLVQERVCF